MSASFHFELVSPERLVFSGEVQGVILPGSEGQMTVLANHAPLIAALKVGIITIQAAEGNRDILVYGGFAEINGNGATVLAERAENLQDINIASLQDSAKNLRDDMADAKSDPERALIEKKILEIENAQQAIVTHKNG